MITNIVCMTNCECPIDLNRLSSSSDAVKYDPRKFNGAVWKDPELGGCCLVFGNGKIIVNGKASDERIAEERLRNYVQLLRQYGWSILCTEVKLVTMSAYYRVDGNLSMDTLCTYMRAKYEPELFPAAMFKREGVHFTCFTNGKILITGIKNNMDDVVLPTLIELELYTL